MCRLSPAPCNPLPWASLRCYYREHRIRRRKVFLLVSWNWVHPLPRADPAKFPEIAETRKLQELTNVETVGASSDDLMRSNDKSYKKLFPKSFGIDFKAIVSSKAAPAK